MASEQIAVIINPISGTGLRRDTARRRAEQAAAIIDERRLDAEVFVTERQGHARELAQAALRRGVRLVVAWGGDGTVNEVASVLVNTDAALGIVPSGSGNGLARELGIPCDPSAAIRVVLDGTVRRIDAGEVDGHLFFNLAGFGLDARVARRFAEGGLGRRGFLRYMEIAVREAAGFTPLECTITFGGTVTAVRALVVVLANARQYGNGALIAPQARLDDGQLDMVVVNHRSALGVLRQAPRLFSGRLAQVPGVAMTRVTNVEISSQNRLDYHVDGEPHRGGPSVKAGVIPGALRVYTTFTPRPPSAEV